MRNKLGNLGWLGFLGFLGFITPNLYYLFFLFFLFFLGLISRKSKGAKKGGEMHNDSAEVRRGLGRYVVVWGVSLVASCAIVIVGNLFLSSWFGIVAGCLVGIAGLVWFINSSRYVRDAWELEQKWSETLDDQGRAQLARSIRKKRDYRDVDRDHAIVCLSLAAGLFALTMLF